MLAVTTVLLRRPPCLHCASTLSSSFLLHGCRLGSPQPAPPSRLAALAYSVLLLLFSAVLAARSRSSFPRLQLVSVSLLASRRRSSSAAAPLLLCCPARPYSLSLSTSAMLLLSLGLLSFFFFFFCLNAASRLAASCPHAPPLPLHMHATAATAPTSHSSSASLAAALLLVPSTLLPSPSLRAVTPSAPASSSARNTLSLLTQLSLYLCCLLLRPAASRPALLCHRFLPPSLAEDGQLLLFFCSLASLSRP